jgi:hypothetical protein
MISRDLEAHGRPALAESNQGPGATSAFSLPATREIRLQHLSPT